MYVHRSNSADALVDALERIVRVPAGEPTDPEWIVVQGRGMERWLSAELARRLGVWANPKFPFPRSIIDRAFDLVLDDDLATGVFQPGALMWSIAKVLPEHADAPAFSVIRNYLRGDEDRRKLIQLAQRIADTFDRYAVYRPEMVLRWEQGEGDEWQAILWRALVATAPGTTHTASQASAFFRRMNQQTGPIPGFPRRISLFGISSLPPLYMRVLSALSKRLDVHLFVLSPSREYWGDIRKTRDVLRAGFPDRLPDPAEESALTRPDGNPLLASLGRLHGDFQQVLEAVDDYVEPDDQLYREAPAVGTVLATLQSDVLALRDRHAESHDAPQLDLAPDDRSVSVHSCHGPMRELEVLHDELVSMFEAHAQLQPRDVVVMMPEVEDYAPLIDAVFGGEARDRPPIPYRIADRSSRASDEVVDALARILAVLSGRFGASEVLDLLTLDLVRETFGISADDLAPIRTWVAETGIRWGVDHEHRAAVNQPAYQENTWRFGLDRLLLGYAMQGPALFGDVRPYDDIEGSATALLSRFIHYCHTLFAFRDAFQQRRSVTAWRTQLEGLLEEVITETELNTAQHHGLRKGFAELAEGAALAIFDEEVPLDSIRSLLESQWSQSSSARGFLSGGVTFCQFKALRSIPFRVVCLLGMSDGAFPRSPQPLGFDLVAATPHLGDHAPRDDDRYLFLEALLSAKDRLLITYVGQSIQNNQRLPPSVLVGELLDIVDESFRAAPGVVSEPARGQIVVQHPLQAFSPRQFDELREPRLFSYSAAHCRAAQSLRRARRSAPPFLAGPIPLDDADERVVTVDQLARYFVHPARTFTERRLGLQLREQGELIDDREPMLLDGLDAWDLGEELLAQALAGKSLRDALPLVRGTGSIPLGSVGKIAVSDVSSTAAAIGETAAAWREGTLLEGLAVDRLLDHTRITGSLTELWPEAQITAQYSKLGRRSELGLWVRHLVLCWLAPAGYPTTSVTIGRAEYGGAPAVVKFRPVEDPASHLRDLVRLYWIGQSAPLPFFPEAARLYASTLARSGLDPLGLRALASARKSFTNTWSGAAEAADPYVQQLFGSSDPLATDYRPFDPVPAGYPTFAEAARTVFAPLLAHREALS